MARTVARLLVAAVLMSLPVWAGGCTSANSTTGGTSSEATSTAQSVVKEWPAATAGVKKIDDGAVLLMVGTKGLATTDVPESWGFTYYLPTKKSVYGVLVDKGVAQPVQDLGAVNSTDTLEPSVDITKIKVTPAEAIAKAREFGMTLTGAVPKSVMVSGMFAEIPGAEQAGLKPGVWTVTFSTSSDFADAQNYEVDMMTGAVSPAADK